MVEKPSQFVFIIWYWPGVNCLDLRIIHCSVFSERRCLRYRTSFLRKQYFLGFGFNLARCGRQRTCRRRLYYPDTVNVFKGSKVAGELHTTNNINRQPDPTEKYVYQLSSIRGKLLLSFVKLFNMRQWTPTTDEAYGLLDDLFTLSCILLLLLFSASVNCLHYGK